MIIKTTSVEETYELGIKIGRVLNSGDIISLNGDLGAGKTQLTKGIAKGLEVEDYITSPTFTIVNEYRGRLPLYHFDVYRINDIEELYEIGFDEYIFGNGISIIEWGDMISEILPKDIIKINIKKVDENIREIHIDSNKLNLGGIK
ncbi:tRNA threonylcarbamoyladenosine biosynthesis protein TsaE [Caloramator quimbayensis]|uniref:tRNA threonylcarbamoyladenosine biosynthesis protein TsaE n=1 Tax=Caloramator quimbayensis TaxID=1147123 RepID=A0A1T4WEH6_9CLOT|nr:tRNA (adenosine(37)-N6)-threonylcarbamoyltransferase complex ATPase subunit type 1 TsaE [Caloramator quimbayensis]SKA75418.1 tRNA threonylcarbamoyladenosine biosynthesis protein TsaE [Caloramator quimbayensis]